MDLGFPTTVTLDRLKIFDHLSPRQQLLMTEAKKIQSIKQYKHCWAKNGSIFLRQTYVSKPIKIDKMQDIEALT